MRATTTHVQITTTCDTPRVCEDITAALLEDRLAACVQVSDVESLYVWEGKRTRKQEYLLTIKTRQELAPDVEETILKFHTYKVPEILTTPILAGSDPYLGWIDEATE